MTAIALTLIIVGLVFVRGFGSNPFEAYIGNYNLWDYIGAICFAVGVLMLAGVGIALIWRFAP